MMKKLGMFAFVMALVVAFALPALAYTVEGAKGERFTLGGSLRYDIGYRNESHAKAAGVDQRDDYGTKQDRLYIFSGVSQSTNITGSFIVGPVSGLWSIVTQSSNEAYHKQVNDSGDNAAYSPTSGSWNNNGFNQKDNGYFDVIYGTYTFGAMSIQAGKLNPVTVAAAPATVLGYMLGSGSHIAMIARGFVYDNKSPQLKFNHQIDKMIGYSVALVAPGTYAEDLKAFQTPVSTTPVLRESYTAMPAIAAQMRLNFGAVAVFPGFLYQTVKWDNLPDGWTDKMDSYLIRLPIKLSFGAFTAWVEGVIGQNIGGNNSNFATVAASEPSQAGYGRNAAGTIINGETRNFWFDFSYKVGPVTPHLYYGQTTSGSTRERYPLGEKETTRTTLGINAFYTVTPNFTIVPEFTIYDLGKSTNLPYEYKIGSDWLAGVQFQFNF